MRNLILLIISILAVAACTPTQIQPPLNNGESGTFKPETSTGTIPDWVKNLRDESLNRETWVQAVIVSSSAVPPSERAATEELYARLHEEVTSALKNRLGPNLQICARNGRWIDESLIPSSDKRLVREFSDGVTSARLVAIKRADLIDRLKPHAHSPIRLGRIPAQPPTGTESALELLRRYVFELRSALIDLCAKTIVGRSDAAIIPTDLHMHEAEAIASKLKDLRSWFRVTMQGGGRKLTLGLKPEEGFNISLIYLGKPAVGLPLRPIGDGLPIEGDFETSPTGYAAMRFTDGISYTGRDSAYPGFALDPDLLLPIGKTGISIDPWLTRVELPCSDNVLVYLNFVEKRKNYTVEDGPFRKGLLKLLQDSGLRVTTESPHRFEDQMYIMEVTGVVNTWALRSSGQGLPSKVTAEGSIQLRHKGGTSIASRAVQGFAEVRPGNEDADHLAALTNAFEVNRLAIARSFRAAFPPIMPPPESVE